MKIYYEGNYKKTKRKLLLSWLINKEKVFSVITDFKSKNFEVIGYLFEKKTHQQPKI